MSNKKHTSAVSQQHWSRYLEKGSKNSYFSIFIRKLRGLFWHIMHPSAERFSYYDRPQPAQVLSALKPIIPIIEQDADKYLPSFNSYLERNHRIYAEAGYFRLFDEKGYFFEKALEHYLSFELLELGSRDRLLDIGCWGSPAAEIAERERGCEAFQQDMIFKPGVNGKCIGSDVRCIPMPDRYFTKITAHCAIDNFEGDADIGFVREAWRLLQIGGKAVIIPLHMATRFENVVDPFQKSIETDYDAVRVFKPLCGFRFGRHYDVDHLNKRILEIAPFYSEIYFFKKGFTNIHKSCNLSFALVLTKKGKMEED